MKFMILGASYISFFILCKILISVNYQRALAFAEANKAKIYAIFLRIKAKFDEGVVVIASLLGHSSSKMLGRFLVVATLLAAVIAFVLTGFLLLSVLVLIVGYYAPYIILGRLQKKRIERLEDQLLDSLILLTNAMKSGLDLVKGIEMIVREMPRPISTEFANVLQEYNLGFSLERALTNMRDRIGSKVYNIFVTALIIQRETGGNVFNILDNVVGTIREKKKLLGKVKALTAQGKMQAWMAIALPWFMALVLTALQPTFMRPFFTDPLGIIVLIFLIFWQAVGIVVIRNVTEVST